MNPIRQKKYLRAYRGLREHYTAEEATHEIDALLASYAPGCSVRFLEKEAEIRNSYLIRSREVRRRVCAVITRTELTHRAFDNLAAEWLLHNLCYRLHFQSESARHAALDYTRDRRRSVSFVTKLLDKLGIE